MILSMGKVSMFCDSCNFKKTFNSESDIPYYPYTSSKIQNKIPTQNPEILKIKPYLEQPKKYRCPKCGRAITPKKVVGKDEQKNII